MRGEEGAVRCCCCCWLEGRGEEGAALCLEGLLGAEDLLETAFGSAEDRRLDDAEDRDLVSLLEGI